MKPLSRRSRAESRRQPPPIDGPAAILVTGCSTGIGRTTAKHLAERGHTVYATARRPETLTELVAAGCHALALDVTATTPCAPRSR